MRRTRRALQEAALSLAAERDVTALTVADVAARAGVNRATVYLHYRDLDDLLVDAMRDALEELAETSARSHAGVPSEDPSQPSAALDQLFARVAAHLPLYRRMLGEDGSSRFTTHLRERIAREVRARLRSDDAQIAAVEADFIAGAIVGVLAGWVTAKSPAAPGAMVAATWPLLSASRMR